jgi:hypothetical protein
MTAFAAVIRVDNSGEDPERGRAGLRQELLPALATMPGFVRTELLVNYALGQGVAVVVFNDEPSARLLTSSLNVGQLLRDGVTVTAVELFEVAALG